MSAAGRFFVTPHAVRRYIERIAPDLSYEDALREIVQAADAAHRVRALPDGTELWRLSGRRRRGGAWRLVIAPPTILGTVPAIVTIKAECG